MPTTKKRQTPQQIAIRAVQQWYDALVSSYESTIGEAPGMDAIDRAFDSIEDTLEADHVKQHGPIQPDEDLTRLMFGRESGYLIGVQVGLRLRGAR